VTRRALVSAVLAVLFVAACGGSGGAGRTLTAARVPHSVPTITVQSPSTTTTAPTTTPPITRAVVAPPPAQAPTPPQGRCVFVPPPGPYSNDPIENGAAQAAIAAERAKAQQATQDQNPAECPADAYWQVVG